MSSPKNYSYFLEKIYDIGDLQLDSDDYAIRVESKHDRLFWIRIERSDGGPAIVTDIKPSTLSIEKTAWALDIGVDAAHPYRKVDTLIFRDIHLTPDETEAKKHVDQIAKILVVFATNRGQRLAAFEFSHRHEKVDVTAELAPFSPLH
jgi:hypothetical protein